MLIPLPEILSKYKIKVNGTIQVGAHFAEEHDIYRQLGIKDIVYIEPCKEAFDLLIGKFNYLEPFFAAEGVELYNFACADYEGEIDMFISHNNQGQSNSILKPVLHLQQHPEVIFNDTEKVRVTLLDKIPFGRNKYNLLVMDVQGAEGLVLKGAIETLKSVEIIYTEVNRGETYENNMLIDDMDYFLLQHGFERVETKWASENLSWGDAIFIKRHLL